MKRQFAKRNIRKIITWNNKILDYEIETLGKGNPAIAIVLTWNNKILDYEIETIMIRFRWKDINCTWNNKILDYEIETCYLRRTPRLNFKRLKQ